MKRLLPAASASTARKPIDSASNDTRLLAGASSPATKTCSVLLLRASRGRSRAKIVLNALTTTASGALLDLFGGRRGVADLKSLEVRRDRVADVDQDLAVEIASGLERVADGTAAAVPGSLRRPV